MHDVPDGELMDSYAHGSEAAFAELFRRYEGRAHAYFLHRVADPSRAGDLYQELFLRLHRFRDTYDRGRPFEPWFFRIAHSVLVDDWRQRYRRAEVGLETQDLRSPQPDAECTVAVREEAEQALGSLSVENARILLDSKVRGLTHAEIAAALSKSVDAVKQAASRSLRGLREGAAFAGRLDPGR